MLRHVTINDHICQNLFQRSKFQVKCGNFKRKEREIKDIQTTQVIKKKEKG